MSNIIAIVGRPNVGKSTFFNRLVERRQAIMDDVPGITRDRHYGYAEWTGHFFTVIDTGGYVPDSEDAFDAKIRDQVAIALDECAAIILVVDCDTGLSGYDQAFANIIRRTNKPVFVAANKADVPSKTALAVEFYALGFDQVYPISAESGLGTGDLLDDVVEVFDEAGDENPDADIPRIAILGRPNAGKSSLLNVLLGNSRSIVAEEAGTTRDAIHSRYSLFGQDFLLVDTAGIRKKTKITEDVEFYSVLRSLKALEDCDICIVVIDAVRGLEAQDVNIIALAVKQGKGIVLMVNKWDLVDKDTHTAQDVQVQMLNKLAPLDFVPIIFSSALTKQRIHKVVETAVGVYQTKSRKISTSQLNKVMLAEIGHYPPPAVKGKYIQIKYITQVPHKTPTFIFFCNHPQYIKDPYKRFIENKMRKHFGYEGVPIRVFFRKK